ncbi:MAG: helix-turn-helix domain-containing protein, partial [Archangium sp.]|nr:helix-turn-helix domain-containing protein [Archangium sp.]
MSIGADHLLSSIGRRVRALRHDRSLTVKQLAEAASLSERFIGSLEAGHANISVLNLAEVARALRVPVQALVTGAQENSTGATVTALLGLRGAGKSTIGAALAKRRKVPFFELDRLVETEAGMSLGELFAMHGERYFRELELRALRRFLENTREAVLATGGGIVTSAEAFELLLAKTHTVWLKARPADHWSRVVNQGDLRPMANRPHAMAELRRRLREREPLYARAART